MGFDTLSCKDSHLHVKSSVLISLQKKNPDTKFYCASYTINGHMVLLGIANAHKQMHRHRAETRVAGMPQCDVWSPPPPPKGHLQLSIRQRKWTLGNLSPMLALFLPGELWINAFIKVPARDLHLLQGRTAEQGLCVTCFVKAQNWNESCRLAN